MEEFDKKCGDCRSFVQHYFQYDMRFLPIRNLGHCKKNITKSKEYTEANNHACPLWEPAVTRDKTEKIEDWLRETAQRLTEVAQVLEDMQK